MYKNFEKGRSMIEMLGVLAIIGVLSVGGIAGYSKAMEMWKLNKANEEYSYLIQGLIEQKDNIMANNVTGGLAHVVKAMNLVPETWKDDVGTVDNATLSDPQGNLIDVFAHEKMIGVVFYLGGFVKEELRTSHSFSKKLCVSLIQNTVQPLAPALYFSRLGNLLDDSDTYYGSQFCGTRRRLCLKDLKLSRLKRICDRCTDTRCGIFLEF